MEIKCPICRKSTNVYPSKLDEHYVCITCCCLFTQKGKKNKEDKDGYNNESDNT